MNASLSNFSILPKIYVCVKLMFNQNTGKISSHLRQAANRNTTSGPSFSRKAPSCCDSSPVKESALADSAQGCRALGAVGFSAKSLPEHLNKNKFYC